MSAWETTKTVLRHTSPVAWLVAEGAEKAAELLSKASNEGIDSLREEIAKQNLQMQFAQQQARIAQELAIAKRIENAQEVEIEEFYDNTAKANAAVSIDQSTQTASIGVGAEGRRVTKRVYHFKGWRPQDTMGVFETVKHENS